MASYTQKFTVEYDQLKSLSSKIQRTSSSISFICKAIFQEVIPIFAKVKGQFANKKDKYKAEKSILQSLLTTHR